MQYLLIKQIPRDNQRLFQDFYDEYLVFQADNHVAILRWMNEHVNASEMLNHKTRYRLQHYKEPGD
jgi:hypothetical protein